MKKFFVTTDGYIAPHKPQNKTVAGFGLLHSDQTLEVTTVSGKTQSFMFNEIKVSGHLPRLLIPLNEGDMINRVFITRQNTLISNNSQLNTIVGKL